MFSWWRLPSNLNVVINKINKRVIMGLLFYLDCFYFYLFKYGTQCQGDWLARNYDNVSEWSNMSICELLFQSASTIKIKLIVSVGYKTDLIIISLKINLFSPWYSWKIAELALSNNHSLTQIWYKTIIKDLYFSYLIYRRGNHKIVKLIIIIQGPP